MDSSQAFTSTSQYFVELVLYYVQTDTLVKRIDRPIPIGLVITERSNRVKISITIN